MWRRVVNVLPTGNNPIRIDARMTPIVMLLDMLHVYRRTNPRNLKQILRIVEQIRALPDKLLVALKVHHIHGIEPDQRHEQPDISLRQLIPRNVPLLPQNLLAPIQRGKERLKSRFVGLLRDGEPASVYAVIDVRVHPAVDVVDGGSQMLRVEVHLGVLRNAIVELVVEHPDDLGAFVADDLLRSRVPEHGDGVSAGVGRVCDFVELPDGSNVVVRVGGGAGLRVVAGGGEDPAAVAVDAWLRRRHLGFRDGQPDGVLETLEVEEGEAAGSPGAREGDVEMVAACYRRELRAWRPGDEAAELRIRSEEGALLRRRHANVRHCSSGMNILVIVSSNPDG
jgi:hypothetical protein